MILKVEKASTDILPYYEKQNNAAAKKEEQRLKKIQKAQDLKLIRKPAENEKIQIDNDMLAILKKFV